MKVFISQPISGRSDEEVLDERRMIIREVMKEYKNVDILNSYFKDYTGTDVEFLGKSIEVLGKADVAVFARGYENSRGCVAEAIICDLYGIKTVKL